MIHKAFTLVELIVVVTILAILATIGFVSYSGYLTGVRDTNRIASLTSISDGFELYRTKNDLPNPDDGINIQIEGTTIANQGYVGVNVLQTIEYSKAGKDPKDDNYYSYYLTDDKKHYQLMAFLEETENLENYFLVGKTNAAVNYSNRYPKVYGKKLGILTDSNNTPVQETTTSNLNFTGGTTADYIARFTDSQNITASGSNLSSIAGNANCKRIKELRGGSKDGIYSINPTGTAIIDVYCDMTTDGGGWISFDTITNSDLEQTRLSLDKVYMKEINLVTQYDTDILAYNNSGNYTTVVDLVDAALDANYQATSIQREKKLYQNSIAFGGGRNSPLDNNTGGCHSARFKAWIINTNSQKGTYCGYDYGVLGQRYIFNNSYFSEYSNQYQLGYYPGTGTSSYPGSCTYQGVQLNLNDCIDKYSVKKVLIR